MRAKLKGKGEEGVVGVVFYFLPLVVYLPVGIYFYFWFRRFFSLFPFKEKKTLIKVLSGAVVVVLVAAGWRVYGFGAVVVLYFLAVNLIMEVVWAVARKAVKSPKAVNTLSFLYKSGIVSVVVVAAALLYGSVNMRNIVRTQYQVETKKALEQDLTLVQISDLHMGTTMNGEKLKDICREIQKEKPDLFLLTGDIFDEHTTRAQMEEAAEILGSVDTAWGTFYVFGNHDYNSYVASANYSAQELKTVLRDRGIQVLEDEGVQAGGGVWVMGRQDVSAVRNRTGVEQLLPAQSQEQFVLLLDHQPVELEENAALGVDLQLSGHTHAGQIWPTGQLGELLGVVEKNYGLKEIGDYHIIVSAGIAGWGYAVRTGGHSEYVVIHVTGKET